MSVAQTDTPETVAVTFEYVSADKPGYDLPWVHVTPDDPDSPFVWRMEVHQGIVVPPFELTPDLYRELHACLLDTFDYDSLNRMLQMSLDVRLSTIAPQGALADTIYELIQWAETNDLTAELVEAATTANPTNVRLATFASRVRDERQAQVDFDLIRSALALRAETAARWEAHAEQVAAAVQAPIAATTWGGEDTPADVAVGFYDFVARTLQQPLVVETVVDEALLARTTVEWHGAQETIWFTDSPDREWVDIHLQAVEAAGRTAIAIVQRECALAAAVRRIEQDGLDGRTAWQRVQRSVPTPPLSVLQGSIDQPSPTHAPLADPLQERDILSYVESKTRIVYSAVEEIQQASLSQNYSQIHRVVGNILDELRSLEALIRTSNM